MNAGAPEGERSRSKKGFGAVFILLLLILILQVGDLFFLVKTFPKIDENKWQAVFLNNDQVYFGNLKEVTKEYVALENIFYLRASQALQQGGGAVPDLSLVKLGSELHGPEDMMYVPRSAIIFWENLKDNSQVVQSIKNFLSQNGE